MELADSLAYGATVSRGCEMDRSFLVGLEGMRVYIGRPSGEDLRHTPVELIDGSIPNVFI